MSCDVAVTRWERLIGRGSPLETPALSLKMSTPFLKGKDDGRSSIHRWVDLVWACRRSPRCCSLDCAVFYCSIRKLGSLAMPWIEITSTAIQRVRYNHKTHILAVLFHDGSHHEYANVPDDKYKDLILSPSAGTYFNREIRNNYPERVLKGKE